MSTSLPLADRLNRPIGVLRLSLTARCNLACPYCCPDVEEPPGLLTLEQQIRVIRVATRLGAQTLRLTGGEPLLSRRLLPLAAWARQQGMELRLIEYMDVGNRNQWTLDQVLPATQMVERIHAVSYTHLTLPTR